MTSLKQVFALFIAALAASALPIRTPGPDFYSNSPSTSYRNFPGTSGRYLQGSRGPSRKGGAFDAPRRGSNGRPSSSFRSSAQEESFDRGSASDRFSEFSAGDKSGRFSSKDRASEQGLDLSNEKSTRVGGKNGFFDDEASSEHHRASASSSDVRADLKDGRQSSHLSSTDNAFAQEDAKKASSSKGFGGVDGTRTSDFSSDSSFANGRDHIFSTESKDGRNFQKASSADSSFAAGNDKARGQTFDQGGPNGIHAGSSSSESNRVSKNAAEASSSSRSGADSTKFSASDKNFSVDQKKKEDTSLSIGGAIPINAKTSSSSSKQAQGSESKLDFESKQGDRSDKFSASNKQFSEDDKEEKSASLRIGDLVNANVNTSKSSSKAGSEFQQSGETSEPGRTAKFSDSNVQASQANKESSDYDVEILGQHFKGSSNSADSSFSNAQKSSSSVVETNKPYRGTTATRGGMQRRRVGRR